MKNPFKKRKAVATAAEEFPSPADAKEAPLASEEAPVESSPAPAEKEPDDDFSEWCRSRVRGGIERRERNDIFEGYNVYGTDAEGHLVCRRWHRYPEHERDFGLSYSRELNFGDFNRRLLAELDKGDLSLAEYNEAIIKAQETAGILAPDHSAPFTGFSDAEKAALHAFCESLDNLKDKSYLNQNGEFLCACESIAGSTALNLRFRKPLTHDALNVEIAGVKKEVTYGYDIDDMWIMGVYNRLHERVGACGVTLLTNEWGTKKESLYILSVKGMEGIDGDLLIAVGGSENFGHFGFYSLDFSNK